MRTYTTTLPVPFELAGKTVSDVELREATVGDVLNAEDIAGRSAGNLRMDAALLCQQITRLGHYTGPVSMEMLTRQKPENFGVLREALLLVEMDEPARAAYFKAIKAAAGGADAKTEPGEA